MPKGSWPAMPLGVEDGPRGVKWCDLLIGPLVKLGAGAGKGGLLLQGGDGVSVRNGRPGIFEPPSFTNSSSPMTTGGAASERVIRQPRAVDH